MVSKETFLKYENARVSGKYNMIMDAATVCITYDISIEDYIDIIKNYNIYYNQYINK